jgi:hypothetical protein
MLHEDPNYSSPYLVSLLPVLPETYFWALKNDGGIAIHSTVWSEWSQPQEIAQKNSRFTPTEIRDYSHAMSSNTPETVYGKMVRCETKFTIVELRYTSWWKRFLNFNTIRESIQGSYRTSEVTGFTSKIDGKTTPITKETLVAVATRAHQSWIDTQSNKFIAWLELDNNELL